MSKMGVSIIICTYNGTARLPLTLDAVLLLNPGIARELILVDNASTEDIAGFCKAYFTQKTSTIEFKLISENQPGLCYARIAGILHASYEYVLFCDDDNALFPDYLELGVQIFTKNPKIGVIGGTGIAKSSVGLPDWFSTYERSFAVGPQLLESGLITQKPGHVYGAGSFFLNSAMQSILEDGFSPSLKGRTANALLSGDDLEWCWLMQLKGYEIYYEKRLKFYHELSPQRLTTEYYIKMKSGTAAGTALLFAYHIYFNNQDLSEIEFRKKYKKASFRTWLIYTRNRIIHKKKTWQQELGLSILKSQNQSYATYGQESAQLYRNLKTLFTVDLKNRN